MNTPLPPPKSPWKKPIKNRGVLLLVLAVVTFAIVFAIGLATGISPGDAKFLLAAALIAVGFAFVIAAIFVSVRWLRQPRNLVKGLFGVACVVTLIALFYAEEDLRGKWAWNHFQRQWEAKGEHFDLASFVPPPVPDDQNFALAPIIFSTYGMYFDKTGHELNPRNTNIVNRVTLSIFRDRDYNREPASGNWAKGTLTDLRGWQTYYRTLPPDSKVTTNEFPTSPQPQSPAKDVLLALSKYDPVVEELRQASRMPYSRFPLEYDKEDPFMILLPHLAKEKVSAQFLRLRTIAELQDGQIDQAAADVKLMCYLTDASQNEPFIISHLVRMAMLNYTLQPIYEGLVRHQWSEAQLAEFDAELAKMDFVADYQHSMRSEAAFVAKEVDYIQRTRTIAPLLNAFNNSGAQHPFLGSDVACFLSPSGWFHQNQIHFCEFYLGQCVPAVNPEKHEVSPKAADRAQANLDATAAHPTPYNALESLLYGPIKKWVFDRHASADKFAYAQASVDLARVGIALERYKLAHGDYPESLDLLAPQFIQKLPPDVIGGQPLKYRRANAHFVLYSIGWNAQNDGGVAALNKSDSVELHELPDPTSGDWVWSYPNK